MPRRPNLPSPSAARSTPQSFNPEPSDDREIPSYREPTIEDMLQKGETVDAAKRRSDMEATAQMSVYEGEMFLTEWAPKLGMTRKQLKETPASELAELMRDYYHTEAEQRDAGVRNDNAYTRASAEKLQSKILQGGLSQSEIGALAERLVPEDKAGAFVPMKDPPGRDGFSRGWSLIQVTQVPKKRRSKFRLLHEPGTAPYVPEPTIFCDMIDGFGDVCDKGLYNDRELEIHQKHKHSSEYRARQDRTDRKRAESEQSRSDQQLEISRKQGEAMMVLAMSLAKQNGVDLVLPSGNEVKAEQNGHAKPDEVGERGDSDSERQEQ